MSDLLREKVIPVGLLILAIFIPAYGCAATARADDTPSPRVIQYATTFHDAVCETLTEHPTVQGVAGIVLSITGDGWTGAEAGQIIGLSVLGWCPQHQPVVRAFIRRYATAKQMLV